MSLLVPIFLGLITGILSGLMGIGGGVILIPMLVLVLGVSQHLAQGISLAVIIPTAITGLMTFQRKGLINYRMAWLLALGAVMGTALSAGYVHNIPALTLRKIFGIFLIVVGCKMLWPGLNKEGRDRGEDLNDHAQK